MPYNDDSNIACTFHVTYSDDFPMDISSINVNGVSAFFYDIDGSSLSSSSQQFRNLNVTYDSDFKTIHVLRDNYDDKNTDFFGYIEYALTLEVDTKKGHLTTFKNGFTFGDTVLFQSDCGRYHDDDFCKLYSNLRDTLAFTIQLSVEQGSLRCILSSIEVTYSDTMKKEDFQDPQLFQYRYRHSLTNQEHHDNILYAVNMFRGNCSLQNIFFAAFSSCSDTPLLGGSDYLRPISNSLATLPTFKDFDILNTYLANTVYDSVKTWNGNLISLVNSVLGNLSLFQNFRHLFLLVENQCENPYYETFDPSPTPTCSPSPTPTCSPSPTPTCSPSPTPTCSPSPTPTCSPTRNVTLYYLLIGFIMLLIGIVITFLIMKRYYHPKSGRKS